MSNPEESLLYNSKRRISGRRSTSVETPTHRSRPTHQRPGADESEEFRTHFMAFRAFIARRMPFFIAGAAGAAAFAFAMTRSGVSERPQKADKI